MSMTETYSGELSEQAKRALSYLFPLIDQWRQRMESAPASPETDSSLFKDDVAVFPLADCQASASMVKPQPLRFLCGIS